MQRAVIYARVSTDMQEDNYSTSSQIAECNRYAQQQGLTIIATIQDVMSGAKLERPGLTEVRAMLRTKAADALIVYCGDRLTRSTAHMLLLRDEMRAAQVTFHVVTKGQASADTPEGNLFDTIEASFAEYERLKMRERLKRGRLGKITGIKGTPKSYGNGKAAYGYMWVGAGGERTLVINPNEVDHVHFIFHLYVEKELSINKVANRLSELCVPTPGDNDRPTPHRRRPEGQWNASSVQHILRNPTYIGMHYHNRYERKDNRTRERPRDEWIGVPIPQLIDSTTWHKAQERLDRGRSNSTGKRMMFYLLAHRVRCACGASMSCSTSHAERQSAHRSYRCVARGPHDAVKPCNAQVKIISAAKVERATWQWLAAEITPDRVRAGLAELTQMSDERFSELHALMDGLEAQRREIDRKHQKMVLAYQNDACTLDDLKESKELTEQARASIDAELQRVDKALRDMNMQADDCEEMFAMVHQVHEKLHTLTDTSRRKLVELLNIRVRVQSKQSLIVESVLGTVELHLDQDGSLLTSESAPRARSAAGGDRSPARRGLTPPSRR